MKTRPVPSLVVFFASLAMISILILGLQGAQAAVTAGSCDSAVANGEMIDGSGNPVVIVAFAATSDVSDTDSLKSIYIDFSGNGFTTDDLASLTTDSSTSGVGVYRDDGTTDDALDSSDTPLTMETCSWSGNEVQITFADGSEYVPQKIVGTYQWGVVIRTSGTVSDGDQIDNTLPANDIAFSDGTTMPAKDLVANTITVDTDAPGSWANINPSGWYSASQEPDVTVDVQDTTSGLDTTSAYYSYSVDGGADWSGWNAASVSGVDGSTNVETITASAVPFDLDSADQNMIQFEISDMVGNQGSSGSYTIMIDASGPDSWGNISPSGWYAADQAPDVTIDVQDAVSGIDTATAYYDYSTDGGNSWSGWTSTTVSGADGSTGVETITASAVPFDQDSGTLNQIEFRLSDKNGNVGTSDVYTIEIDTTMPDSWANIVPSGWHFGSQTPDVSIDVQDADSGLDTANAYYSYSTDGGSSWSAWTGASVSGVDGSTNVETITASAVPFDQDSVDQNMIQFEITDMAGNTGTSSSYTIEIDSMAPDSWNNIDPSGWYTASQSPDVSVQVQDTLSGLDTASAYYSYSTDGGSSWSAWTGASVSGVDGSTNVETITASAVPFDHDSGTQNMIRFEINDVAGNTGVSGDYTIQIETTGPDSWANLVPSGWYNADETPTVTIDVQDTGTGIDIATANYQYSTDGGTTWSGWIAATVSGADGSTSVETITAASVPFDQESGAQNQIQFQLSDKVGNVGTSLAYVIEIDTVAPDSWANIDPSGWVTASQEPDVTIQVQDDTSGLDTMSAYYQYSVDGGSTWSAWTAASVSGVDGSTNMETITASAVPFDQDSADQNMIQFEISDLAGNTGNSGSFTIMIDASGPDSWANLVPSGWYTTDQAPDVTIDVQDAVSGIDTATAWYQYSTDGGNSWSALTAATVTGSDGSTSVETITASAVPFDQDSGTQNQVQFQLSDMFGNVGTSPVYTIEIDTMAPDDWANVDPSGWYTASESPSVTITVQDTGSGLDTTSALYTFSTDGGTSWSGWNAATVSGVDGSTDVETITAGSVPFNQESGDQNRIQFSVNDMLGNTGQSGVYTIQIDTVAPDSWNNIDPSGWYTASQEPDVTIQVQDDTSGLDTASAYYSYTIDGGTTWSAWNAATVTGVDGSNSVETITASAVPFDQDSGTQDMIQFEINDIAGNTGNSGSFTIMTETVGPDNWANVNPSGWYTADQQPTVTIGVQDTGSGIDTATANYQYSTDGGNSWSGWLAASITGVDGSTNVETMTASNVPFDKDSGSLNLIQFELNDVGGNNGLSGQYTIQIDTAAPDNWNNINPSGWYTASQTPDVTIDVQDDTSGLDTASASYSYSVDGGGTWSVWIAASVSGSDGSTNVETITASAVPFDQDSMDQNMIQFEISDMAGNTGMSGQYTIQVDSMAPDSWNGIDPSGWYTASQEPDVSIQVQDDTSGLDTASAYYSYSTDGGASWSGWNAATVTGSDGSTGVETITASAVPFDQDSGTQDMIQFEINDMAGNTGNSGSYTIMIETVGPDSWANLNPSGWDTADQEPTVTIDVQDPASGIDTTTAYYQYSTDGGDSWSGWIPASVTGYDGSTNVETMTASMVPFDQDSGSLNLIQFELNDMAGNTGQSDQYTIQIDTVAPDNWNNISPSGWFTTSQTPDVTIDVQDDTSGLDTASAYYSYSTDGGVSWSNWTGASVSGYDGSTNVETITARGVPFLHDSADQDMIQFEITDMAGNTGNSGPFTIMIDIAAPGSWAGIQPVDWIKNSQMPTVTVAVQDVTSGLQVSTAFYEYSTDGGNTWSAWTLTTMTGTDGTTAAQTITATNVPFNQDSGTQNVIQFRVSDMAGLTGTSPAYVIRIDTHTPGNWAGISPTGWYNASQTPTVTITVQDSTSGLDVSSSQYRFSTDGGNTWSAWIAAITSGSGGTTLVQTMTAANVPFGQDSGTANQIEFRIPDLAGNTGTSTAYTIMIDTSPPGGWAAVSPSGWYNASKAPTVTITVQDLLSGLSVGSAQYQFSTNGGAAWSIWKAATVSGTDGTIGTETITAASVPFGKDSGTLDMIRFMISDMAGNFGTSADYTIMIDTQSPGLWNGVTPTGWFNPSQDPTVTVLVADADSGLDTSSAQFQFSTDGGTTWSDWAAATVTGTNGNTAMQIVSAAAVSFNQDSGTQNVIRFRISDVTGNTGTSDGYVIMIDTHSPGNWTGESPAGWYNLSRTPTVTVQGSDGMSGLATGSALYQYSTDGGATWSDWSMATVTGTDGTTVLQTLTAAGVPFNHDSETQNMIRFRITDMAGNTGTSANYTVGIDTIAPGNWTGISPSGWYNASRTPTVTVLASDGLAGLNITSALYQFSTNGGAAWSAWAAATVTGTAGAQTLTASNVSFNADSPNFNKIRFRVSDMAGNTGTSPDYIIKVDTTPPTTSMQALPKYSNSLALQLSFTASDNVSGLARLELWYRVNGGAIQQFSGNLTSSPVAFTAASDGLYEFYLRGLDNAGNYEPAPAMPDANVTVKTSVPEPVVKIKEGTDTTESTAHVSGTVEPGSSVQVNDKDVAVDASGHFATTVSLSEGSNKIKVTVTDPAGNTKTVEKTVNRKAASSILMWLILVLVIVVVLVAIVAALMMRGRGKKPAPTQAVAEPVEAAPAEAVPVTEVQPSEAEQQQAEDEAEEASEETSPEELPKDEK